ncbi:MAG: tripartite tricarboxylate transporter substrate binding protein [Burkholderiales bacterium]
MKTKLIHAACSASIIAFGLSMAATVHAQTAATGAAQAYPTKPIRYIVAFPAGGTTDLLGRLIGQKLTEAWGQPVIMDNRAGAAGSVGSEAAAKAPADGYTLLGGTISSHSINSSLYSKLAYHPLRDFAPVTRIASVPNVLVVHPSLPVKTVKEFAALAKARPGQLRFASSGSGTSQHLSGELFNLLTGVKMVHVPYKGGNFAMTDLIGGQIELSFENAPNCVPHVKSGRLRAIGVTTLTRAQALPDTPPINDSVPGFEVGSWQGLFVPAGVPPAIVNKLNTEVRRILALDDVRNRISGLGAEVATTTPEQFVEFIKAEMTKWEKVVKAAGARVD